MEGKMFNLINYKNIYKELTEETENICQLIIKNNFKDKLLSNQNWNVALIYYHLVAILYVFTKNKKGTSTAEKMSKKLIYETLVRLPDEYENHIISYSSNIITKYVSIYRQAMNSENDIKLDFFEELAKGICEIFAEDELYFMKEEYKKLIDTLKIYFTENITKYENLIK